MIAASVVLLVVAMILLIVGIGKSSVAFLIFSLGATLVAAGLLYASFVYYRREASEEEEKVHAGAGYPVAYAPQGTAGVHPAAPPAATPSPAGSADPWVQSNGRRPLIPDEWEELNAKQARELVSTLGLETLHVVRAHEVENAHRKTVMEAIDGRIEEIVSVRDRLKG